MLRNRFVSVLAIAALAGVLVTAGPAPEILAAVSASAARQHPADHPAAMAAYVTRALSG